MSLADEAIVILDLESTGLEVNRDKVIEVAVLPVDAQTLEPLHAGYSTAIHWARLPEMNDYVYDMHNSSGLLRDLDDAEKAMYPGPAETSIIKYLDEWADPDAIPMCGSSIHFDRKFLEQQMPNLEKWFHRRIEDISSLKNFWLRWFVQWGEPPKKKKAHRAIDDCYESLEELKWYYERFTAWEKLAHASVEQAPVHRLQEMVDHIKELRRDAVGH